MRPVTLDQFKRWVKKHENKTWSLKGKAITFQVKYFDLNFDTRTWNIFRICARVGGEPSVVVHVGDTMDKPYTLLEALEIKLGWR